jgi:hypothetical protein
MFANRNAALKRFRAKWIPVRVKKKTHPIKNLESLAVVLKRRETPALRFSFRMTTGHREDQRPGVQAL